MNNRQLKHEEVDNTSRTFPIVVICENISSPENVGMVFRISEAMGVKEIVFTESSITPPNRKISKVSRSTDRIVPFRYFTKTKEAIAELKSQDYKFVALEITSNSIDLSKAEFSSKQKIALLIGSEKFGIDAQTLSMVDSSVEISLFGSNTSMNVVSALGISLYEITKQMMGK